MFLQNVTKVIEGSPETEAGADNLRDVKDIVDRACALFRGGQHHELETLTNEIRDEISKTIILKLGRPQLPNLSILRGFDSYMLLYMPGMRSAIDFHRKILSQRQLRRR